MPDNRAPHDTAVPGERSDALAQYAHPEVLVTTDWVLDNLQQPRIRIIEIDEDPQIYEAGHIPSALGFNWQTDLQDRVRRDIVSQADFERLLSASGVANDDTVVLYGDNHNWFAAYGFWLFKMYGHRDVRLMNGGRQKWIAENKPVASERPVYAPTHYVVAAYHREYRASLAEVLEAVRQGNANLVDVRSPDEYTGKILAPPGMTETAQRGGHIPGARNVPWKSAVQPDGTFKSADELRQIYLVQAGVDPHKPTIAYCRIGERSSHTWFVLRYLLGLDNVKNYDGSWTEYGNVVGVPIEKGSTPA